MAGGKIHFEVFVKKHRKAGWTLADARDDREEAIALAKKLLDGLPKGSVRVSKERFDEDARVFRSATIFEEGAEKFALDEDKTGDGSLPCLTPDDLSNPSARDTIHRVLDGWLERQQVTPMELLHRPDLVEMLETGGTEMQHAVQKVAVASAKEGDSSVHAYVKQLNELVGKALTRVYQDGRAGKLPKFPASKSFRAVVEDIYSKPSAYRLRAAIADRLGEARSYRDKVQLLLDFSDDLPTDPATAEAAISEVDAFLAEMLGFDSGLSGLVGQTADLGEEIQRLADIFTGKPDADSLVTAPKAAWRLANRLPKGDLEWTKSAIAQRILAQLRKPRRMKPDDVAAEVKLARALAQQLIMAQGPDLPAQSLQDAFSQRSSRLLTPETIGDYLVESADAGVEIDRLLALEENIVGAQNKRKLAGYIRAALGAHKTETYFLRGPGGPAERLAGLVARQKRVEAGHFPPEDEAELMAAFDAMGVRILEETRLLERVADGDRPALDRAAALLKLATTGILPKGDCTTFAQTKALRLLRSDTGLKEAQADTDRAKLSEIETLLKTLAPKDEAAA
ncbi:hypothetical protein [Hyphobacterium marinum]|uniref:CHAD domain-containing protein n=1 Tax=Hyphobacterium marinum TaxID=3116574 RepID=A0ABU7LUF7_9PROT|nr:hypothetical protein [Hyphobacterium sp. Y6023]MEE2565192.1 hypothetical protein [Hyphobacterium sp. Y6023]